MARDQRWLLDGVADRVPLLTADQDVWGYVELRFQEPPILTQLANSEVVPLIAFTGTLCFIVFYAYLSRMLKHLDPSRAIPPRVRSALDTMAEGLLVLDRKQHIVLANQALADIVGQEVDTLLGAKVDQLRWLSTQGDDLDTRSTPWAHCLANGQPKREAAVCLVDRDQIRRTFLVNCSPVMVSAGKLGGVLVSLDDVTQLEQKKHELARARDAAESANQAKSDFLANMSHEIRTPLNAILGFTEVLRRGYGKQQQDPRKHLSTIHSSGQHLLRLINDILDLSKVESGRMEVECIRCSPVSIIREVVQVLQVKADEKKISLKMNIQGAVPETIFTDSARLRQIVTNLVGNAIKFTEDGEVKVSVAMANQAGEPLLKIAIADSGIGMSPSQMKRIFDPFSQADSSVTRRFGGTGLGLTISRRFAKALGGDIEVRSQVGSGSEFIVSISTGDLNGVEMITGDQIECLESSLADESESWQFAKQRVLVVDDGEENRELMTLVLQEAGLDVDVAQDGQVGVRKVLEVLGSDQAYEIVLMDMQMPVMDGFTATRLLRDKGVSTPIYALTANAMKGFEKNCLEVGCTGYLTKPIEIDLLLDALGQALNASRAPAGSANSNSNFDSTATIPFRGADGHRSTDS